MDLTSGVVIKNKVLGRLIRESNTMMMVMIMIIIIIIIIIVTACLV